LTNHDHGLANNVHGLETMTYASLSWFETNIAGKCNADSIDNSSLLCIAYIFWPTFALIA
jgi:hypothetical protein